MNGEPCAISATPEAAIADFKGGTDPTMDQIPEISFLGRLGGAPPNPLGNLSVGAFRSGSGKSTQNIRFESPKPQKEFGAIDLFLSQFKSPIVITLIAAAVLSYFLHDPTDSLIILAIVLSPRSWVLAGKGGDGCGKNGSLLL